LSDLISNYPFCGLFQTTFSALLLFSVPVVINFLTHPKAKAVTLSLAAQSFLLSSLQIFFHLIISIFTLLVLCYNQRELLYAYWRKYSFGV